MLHIRLGELWLAGSNVCELFFFSERPDISITEKTKIAFVAAEIRLQTTLGTMCCGCPNNSSTLRFLPAKQHQGCECSAYS